MPARQTSDTTPDHAESDQPANRAARARGKAGATAQTEPVKSTLSGRRNPVVTPRRWATRRSGS
jgi:hypothetical protein